MTEEQVLKHKQFDLEERTLEFAKRIRVFCRNLPKTISNYEDIRQLVRSSGSIGANYVEANESFSKKDFCLRVKISRKEAKETIYWLSLVSTSQNKELETERVVLIREATELMKILGAIIEKTK